MIKKLLFCISFSSLLLLLAAGATRADEIDDLINAQIKKRQIPGLSLAVLRDGKVIKAAGYGLANMELNVPATKDTVYEIGSISKQFASEAIMLLVEDGKIDLDDPVIKYLPANAPDSWKTITIRQVLNHTAGLKDWTEIKEFSYRREYTAGEFIDLIKGAPLQYAPGTNWAYTNTGPPLLGMVVEKASGKRYEEFVSERIFKPMGFPTIRFRRQEDIVANRASGYELKDGKFTNGEPFRPRVIAPSGGVLASAVDLAGWFTAVLNGKLVRKESLEQMLAPVRLADGRRVTHGFAFFTDSFNGHKMIFHHGSTVGGFGSVVRYYPRERITIAIIGNVEDGGWGPEYISQRVANFYIPGTYLGGIKTSPDPDPKFTAGLRPLLQDIGDSKPSDMLTASYAPRISADFRKQTAENLKGLKSFSYLAAEAIGEDHFVLDPTLIRAIHYKLVTGDRTVYYTFRLDKYGKVGFIVVTEE
jgi:CubicO group peptidase (beta-lactamase class C family)